MTGPRTTNHNGKKRRRAKVRLLPASAIYANYSPDSLRRSELAWAEFDFAIQGYRELFDELGQLDRTKLNDWIEVRRRRDKLNRERFIKRILKLQRTAVALQTSEETAA